MASIKQRGENGGWEARIRKSGYPPLVKTFTSKRDAEGWAKKTEASMEQRTWLDHTEADTTTLADALQRYLTQIVSKKKGAVKESSLIKLWAGTQLAGLTLARIRGADVAKLMDEWLAAGYAAATVVRRVAVLSNLFTVARKRWGMDGLANPVESVEKPRVNNARSRRVLDEEIDRICAATQSAVLPAIIKLALATAARRSETVGLQRKHVHTENQMAHLPDTKNSSARDVPLSDVAVDILDGLPRNASGKVFDITPDAASRAFARARNRARKRYLEECAGQGVEPSETFLVDLILHDLRHEATTRLAAEFDVLDLSAITGHKDLRMLKRYHHPKASDLAKRMNKAAKE